MYILQYLWISSAIKTLPGTNNIHRHMKLPSTSKIKIRPARKLSIRSAFHASLTALVPTLTSPMEGKNRLLKGVL